MRGQLRDIIGVQKGTCQGKGADPRNKAEELHSHWWCCYGVQGLPLFDHWTAAGEENNMRCITEAFPAASPSHKLSQHRWDGQKAPKPLSFSQRSTFLQRFNKPVSTRFICRREGANDWAITPVCRVKYLPTQSSQPQAVQRKAPALPQALGRKGHPLQEAHSKGPAKPSRDDCPSAITHAPVHFLIIHTQGTFLVWFLLSKKVIINPSYFTHLPTTYSSQPSCYIFFFFLPPLNPLFC